MNRYHSSSNRTTMKTQLPVALLQLFALNASLTSSVMACRCVPGTPEEHFSAADVVFSGRVVAVTRPDLELHAFIDWLEVWKGELPIVIDGKVPPDDGT